MRKLFLILACGVVATWASTCSDYNENDIRIFSDALKSFSFRLLHAKFRRNTSQSHSIAPLSIFCVLTQLANHAEGSNYRRLLNILNAQSKREIRRILMLVNEIVENLDSREEVDYDVFADKSHPLSKRFKRNYASICGGLSENIDFSNTCEAAYYLNQWFNSQSNELQSIASNASMFKNNGLVFASSFSIVINLNHINNPTGTGMFYFNTSRNRVIKLMSLYGNAFVEYAYNKELDAKVLKLQFYKDEYYGVFICPSNPINLPQLVEKLQDVRYFNKIEASTKPMCVNLKLVIGAVHMVNKLNPYLREFGISLKDFRNVYENGTECEANVNEVLQEVHITPTPINKRADINSPKCQAGPYPEVHISSSVFYNFMYKFGAPAASGVFDGPIYGGDV